MFNGFKSFLILRNFSILEQITFKQSETLLSESRKISKKSAELLVTLKREVVIKLRVKSRF
jgi:hypothetical protein